MPEAEAATSEQVAAVHALFGSERVAHECDILINTALAALRDGPKSIDDLVSFGKSVWTGAGVDHARMAYAMKIAHQAEYVDRVRDSSPCWALTELGASEAQAAHEWADAELAKVASQLRDRAQRVGAVVSERDARLWVAILARAIGDGIRHSFRVFQGEVDPLPGQMLVPRAYDQDLIQKSIESSTLAPENREVMFALALEAIDRSTDFGNSLVTNITIGYILHAFVSRRDHIRQRRALGSLAGQKAILDTMVLLRLLGGPEQARQVWEAIAAARAAGMEVIAAEHTLDELIAVIGAADNDALFVERALADALSPKAVMAVVVEEPVRLWLQGREAGIYRDWNSFRQAAQALNGRLARAGVKVRVQYTGSIDVERQARAALDGELGSNADGTQRRRPRAIERDATTMALAAGVRSAQHPGPGLWPGVWVITDDTHMGPAFRRVSPNDPFDLTLAPSQWVAVVSTCASPADLPALAQSAASLIADGTTLSITGAMSVEDAVDIARLLDPETTLDIRIEQLNIREALAASPSLGNDGDRGARTVVALVAAHRAKRANRDKSALMLQHKNDVDRMEREIEVQRSSHARELEQLRFQADKTAAEIRDHAQRLAVREVAVRFIAGTLPFIGLGVAIIIAEVGSIPGSHVPLLLISGLVAGTVSLIGLWRHSAGYRSDTHVGLRSLVPALAESIGSFVLAVLLQRIVS